MASERIATSDKLADALMAADAPADMVIRARAGHYDDYKSSLATPYIQLVLDASGVGLVDIAERARNGEWDAQKWESDEWAASAEGQETLAALPVKMRRMFE